MPALKLFRLLGPLSIIAGLLAATGCGGSGIVIPHTTGNYSKASFKGSYVFEMHGFISASGNPYREVGVITADGNGNITAGVDYVTSVGLSVPASSVAISGSYTVANDGTGSVVLGSTALSSVLGNSPITLALTLASTSEARLLEADFFADGAGNAELQDPSAIGTTPSGGFVFRLHQDVSSQSAAESQVGFMSITSGSLTGSMDQNLQSNPSSLTLTAGTFGVPSSFGVGSGSFTDNASTPVTTNFVYFVVNSGKFVLLVSNAGAIGSGSAEAQSGTVSAGLSGTYVFGSRGDDLTDGAAAFATVGEFAASGATISTGVLDSMQDNNYALAQAQFTGSAVGSPSAQGRVQVTLSTGTTMVLWMVSPSRAFFLDEGEPAVEDGTADLQTATSFSASTFSGQYAIVMDGIDLTSVGSLEALARIGTLQLNGSGKLTLVEVVNNSSSGAGAQSPAGGALTGNYQAGGSGRITSQITNNSGGGPDLVMYAVSASQAYVLQIDQGTNTSGIVQLQQ